MSTTFPPDTQSWWCVPGRDVAAAFATDPVQGLTDAQAAERLEATGPNALDEQRRPSVLVTLGRQFTGAVTLVLLGAAVVASIVGDAKDTVVILAVVILGAIVGFLQERRAERALSLLRALSAPFARVVRHGEAHLVPARAVVPGDLIELETGDVVPADARLLRAPNLRVNEAPLTGESVPVDKITDALREAEAMVVADQRNMVFKGTAVAYGRGTAVVTATGMDTRLGGIARLLYSHHAPATPLQLRLGRLGRDISIATIAACSVVFAIGIVRGEAASEMLLSSVSLAVAAIPEALPAVVTISLALGAQRMAKLHAVIRTLPAVETLGSVTVIASDKTGTITEGTMVVERVWLADGREFVTTGRGYAPTGEVLTSDGEPPGHDELLTRLVHACVLCNDAALVPPDTPGARWQAAGDPTEAALLAFAGKALEDADALSHRYPRVAEEPFEATRRRMTTFHSMETGRIGVMTKGAVEAITADPRARERAEEYASAGYRVLAFASSDFPDLDAAETAPAAAVEFLGLVAIADPPRLEVGPAIAEARAAGIRCVMVTGDHPATARAVAGELGLLGDGTVVTGEQVETMSPDELTRATARVAVFARIGPEQKLRIVDALKRAGHVVAMTGDGVNDAPALKQADIGIAMGIEGTDVAKEASDMVLTDDNFATIVVAAREGRRIYDNIRRFVRYGLTGGSAEIWVMLFGPLLGLPLPLVPVQILWLNLLTHGVPGLALGVEPADPESMRRPPRPVHESFLGRGLWQHVLVFGLLTAGVTLAVGGVAHERAMPWQTMLLTSLAFLQLGNAFAVRSETRSTVAVGLTTNRLLLGAVVGTIAAQLGAIYFPPLQKLLETDALDAHELLGVTLVSTTTFWAIEVDKLRRRRAAAHAGTR